MKVNFNKSFVDFKGNEVRTGSKPVLISEEIGRILFALGTSGNAPHNAEEKYMAYKLCNRITAVQGEVELTTEEAAFIVKVCGETLTAGGYGQVRDLIESNG